MLCSAKSEVDGGGERKDKKRPPQMAFQISFQKVRSDSRCRIRRDVRLKKINERPRRARRFAQKCSTRREDKYKTDVYQDTAELQQTSV